MFTQTPFKLFTHKTENDSMLSAKTFSHSLTHSCAINRTDFWSKYSIEIYIWHEFSLLVVFDVIAIVVFVVVVIAIIVIIFFFSFDHVKTLILVMTC